MKTVMFAVVVLAAFCFFTELAGIALIDAQSGEQPEYAADLIKVKLTSQAAIRAELPEGLYAEAESFGIPELDQLMESIGGVKIIRAHRRVKDEEWEQRTGFDRWFLIKLDGRLGVPEALAAAKGNIWLELEQPEYMARLAATPNDAFYANNWGHNNTAQLPAWYPPGSAAGGHTGSGVGTVGFDSDAELAWDRSQVWGSSSIVIAIIDSGVDTDHPDLRVVTGYDYGNGDTNPNPDAIDDGPHGTNCAGVAAARGNNTIGVAGIAGGCSVMPLKVIDSAENLYFTYVDNALTHAADNGAEVISMSFSATSGGTEEGDIPATDAALEYAYTAGCVMFAATGNGNASSIGYPANHNKVNGVGAASPTGQRKSTTSSDGEYWWGSNYGVNIQDNLKAVDLMGPTILPSTDIAGATGYSTTDYYMWFNGTSCATPYVAGVAALLLSKSPSLTNAQVRSILTATATDMTVDGGAGWDRYTGYGLVNADRALVNVWDGSTSSAWNTASNWSLNIVPISTQDVLIPTLLIRYPVVSTTQYCHSVMVESPGSVTISTGYLIAYGDFVTHGSLVMNHADGNFYVSGDLIFESGATTSITALTDIWVEGNLEFREGSSVNMANSYLYLYGTGSTMVRIYAPATVHNLVSDKADGQISAISAASTETLTIGGNLYVNAGSTFYHYDSGTTILKGGMWVYTGAICQFDAGTISMEGTSSSNIRFYETGIGNHLNRLTINKGSAYSVSLLNHLEVKSNLTINSGSLNSNTFDIYLGGNWDNNLSAANFLESTGAVELNGTGAQYLYTETFNVLRMNKASGAMYITTGNTVNCASYDWMAGEYIVTGGTFNVSDLADPGILGTITITSGTVNYTQDSATGSFVDFCCSLTMSNGTFNIYGGYSTSFFGWLSPATLNLSGGTLNIIQSIYMPAAYTTVENITGGTIRTSGYFNCARGDFTPSGGTLELYGNSDATVYMVAGSNLWNLAINKNPVKQDAALDHDYVLRERDGTPLPQTRSNTAYAYSDLVILNDFWLITGGFDAYGYDLAVGGDWTNSAPSSIAFNAGIGKVYFSQAGDIQNVWGPNIFNVVIDNHTGGALTFNDATVIDSLTVNNIVSFHSSNTIGTAINLSGGAILAFYYNYTSTIGSYAGGGHLRSYYAGNHVVISDVTQNGFYGTLLASAGYLELHQDAAGWPDLNCALTITSNGRVDILGGNGATYVGYSAYASLAMDAGELNVLTSGLNISSSGPGSEFSVSGGVIRLTGYWQDYRGNFDPSGGTVEMAGNADAQILTQPTSYFYNLTVNKAAGKSQSEPEYFLERDGSILPITRTSNLSIYACNVTGTYTQTAANIVLQNGDVNFSNTEVQHVILGGEYRLDGYDLNCAGNLTLYGSLTVNPGSIMYMGSGRTIIVYGGANLLLAGNSTSPATLTRGGAGYYGLSVRSGGSLGGTYGIFEYMNANGISLMDGSTINPTYPLDHCTFRNGSAGGCLLSIRNNQFLNIPYAVFPPNTWSGYCNVYKSLDSGGIYFTNWSGAYGGHANELDPYARVFWQGDQEPVIKDLLISYVSDTNRIRLDWIYPYGAVSYKIYRSNDPEGVFTLRANTTSVFWTEVVPGRNYFYKVTAILP